MTNLVDAIANTFAFGPGFKYGVKDIDKFFVGFDDQFNKLAKLHYLHNNKPKLQNRH